MSKPIREWTDAELRAFVYCHPGMLRFDVTPALAAEVLALRAELAAARAEIEEWKEHTSYWNRLAVKYATEPCCEMRPCGDDLLHQDDCPHYLDMLVDPANQPVSEKWSDVHPCAKGYPCEHEAELARQRPVIDAAIGWRRPVGPGVDDWDSVGSWADERDYALIEAVDAYRDGGGTDDQPV